MNNAADTEGVTETSTGSRDATNRKRATQLNDPQSSPEMLISCSFSSGKWVDRKEAPRPVTCCKTAASP